MPKDPEQLACALRETNLPDRLVRTAQLEEVGIAGTVEQLLWLNENVPVELEGWWTEMPSGVFTCSLP